jgi:hypothetical protein
MSFRAEVLRADGGVCLWTAWWNGSENENQKHVSGGVGIRLSRPEVGIRGLWQGVVPQGHKD